MEELAQAQKDFLTGFYTREYLISTLLKRIINVSNSIPKEKLEHPYKAIGTAVILLILSSLIAIFNSLWNIFN